MAALVGDNSEHDLGEGVRLTAPGLDGAADLSPTIPPFESASGQLLDHALGNAGFTRRKPVLLSHTTPATGDVTVRFPSPSQENNALLLVQDATGAVTWHRPVQPTAAAANFAGGGAVAAAAADGPGDLTFSLPSDRFATGHKHAGLLSRIAGVLHHFSFHPEVGGTDKVLSVLEYPVSHLAAWGATKWFDQWDRNKHPAVIRWFPPTGGQSVGEALSPTDWAALAAGGPVLLFIHGIFSTCSGAFDGIGNDAVTWPALHQLYDGRIIGYDHPTACVGPDQNAADFLAQIPEGIELTVDIVCHSRGGLVARCLAGQGTPIPGAGSKVSVNKIVFAATPNGGSAITEPAKWDQLIDRVGSVMTLPLAVLPAPVDAVTSVLAGILELVKVVGLQVAVDLPGLADMAPGSAFLQQLGAFTGATPTYYAAGSDFEPGPVLANLFHKIDDEGRVVDDAIFPGVRNDIAVPTYGVWDPANSGGVTPPPAVPAIPGFPVLGDKQLPLGVGSVYWHCAYFNDPDMRTALVRWLTPIP